MTRHTPLAALCLVWSTLAALGCSDDATPCQTNDDCRPGYRCDQTVYAGQCVQSVYVIRCGNDYCQYGRERCVAGACQEITDGGGRDMSLLDDGGAPDRGAGGAGGDPDRGLSPDPEPEPGADAEVDPEPPSVVITAPFDGSVLLDTDVTLEGQIFRLRADATVRLVIDGATPGRPLAVDAAGRFEETLPLVPGHHRLTVVAEQRGLRGEASVAFRLDAFVAMQNGGFVQGGVPYTFVGLAMPDLLEVAAGDPAALDVVFEQALALGARVIRTRAYDDRPQAPTVIQRGPGDLAEPGLGALDRLIERAGVHGVKLLLSLGDGGSRYGGPEQYLRWAGYLAPIAADRALFYGDGPMREQYKAYVRAITTRVNALTDTAYRDDPAILGWIVLDGADGAGAWNDNTGNGIAAFHADVIPVIRANAPRQLVATGDIGWDINPGPYGDAGDTLVRAGLANLFDGSRQVGWQRDVRIPGVDFATLTLDPGLLGFQGDAVTVQNLGAAWIRGHALVAAVEGRPLVITTRIPRDRLSLPDRRTVLRAWFDELVSLELAGYLVGDFQAPGQITDQPAAWSWTPGTEPGEPQNLFADLVMQFAAELAARR